MTSKTSIISKLSANSSSRPPRNPNLPLRVIGCGLGRTGTNSLSAALETLLHGPILHTGSEIFVGDEDNIRTWTAILRTSLHRNNKLAGEPQLIVDSQLVNDSLKRILSGYVGATDTPIALFTPELVSLYPDVLFICTTREVNSWWRSWQATTTAPPLWVVAILLYPVPVWRSLAGFIGALESKMRALYYGGTEGKVGKEMYERHLAWIKEVVPKERLFFYDIKQGWGPLCEILGVEEEDRPEEGTLFPRGNDTEEMEKLEKELVRVAMLGWARIGAVMVGIGAVGAYYFLW